MRSLSDAVPHITAQEMDVFRGCVVDAIRATQDGEHVGITFTGADGQCYTLHAFVDRERYGEKKASALQPRPTAYGHLSVIDGGKA